MEKAKTDSEGVEWNDVVQDTVQQRGFVMAMMNTELRGHVLGGCVFTG